MEMQNIILKNLKKGIKTAQKRISKGLEGKKLVYALRYIKGAKTRIRKIKQESKSFKIYKTNKAIKGIFKSVINKMGERKKKRDFLKRWAEFEEIKNEREFLKKWEDLEE